MKLQNRLLKTGACLIEVMLETKQKLTLDYYYKKKNYMACIYNGSIFFSIICTLIVKLIFVIFASVEIPVQDKMGCWNKV